MNSFAENSSDIGFGLSFGDNQFWRGMPANTDTHFGARPVIIIYIAQIASDFTASSPINAGMRLEVATGASCNSISWGHAWSPANGGIHKCQVFVLLD